MAGDGACFFRAVAFHVLGDQELHAEVRERCLDYMLQNRDHFAEFVDDEDFDSYIARKRDPAAHANHPEIQACSEIFGRTVDIYSYSDGAAAITKLSRLAS